MTPGALRSPAARCSRNGIPGRSYVVTAMLVPLRRVRECTSRRFATSYIPITARERATKPGPQRRQETEYQMKTRIAAVVTALVLGVAPISSAMAFSANSPFNPFAPRDVETTGSIGPANTSVPFYGACPMSSASEGNANQQNFPVKQYGQTSGGQRC